MGGREVEDTEEDVNCLCMHSYVVKKNPAEIATMVMQV